MIADQPRPGTFPLGKDAGQRVSRPKPAPDLFLHASRRMGVAPVQVTVVEDTATGIAAAKAARIRAIGFAGTTPAARLLAAGADAIAATTTEVGALLGLG